MHHLLFFADLECLIAKIDECKINPENSSTIKVGAYSINFFNVYNIFI